MSDLQPVRAICLAFAAAAAWGCAALPPPMPLEEAVREAHGELMSKAPQGARLAVWEVFYEEDSGTAVEITEALRVLTLEAREEKGLRLVETEERTLSALERELDIEASGLVDDNEAARIGHWLGVDMIILGKIGPNRTLWVWLVDVESRERVASVRKRL